MKIKRTSKASRKGAKLLGLAVGLFVAAAVGVVQLQTLAKPPGQVGNAPRCNVNVVGGGGAGHGFTINGRDAKISFKLAGKKTCKVQVSVSSFFSPALSGKPWSKQILFKRQVKVFSNGQNGKTYTLTTQLPPANQPQKGCFYQVDFSYGDHNILPILGGHRDKLVSSKCNPPKPSAECKAVTVNKLTDTKFRFTASAEVKNGAKLKSYKFVVKKGSSTVLTKNIKSTKKSVSYVFSTKKVGKYNVRAYAITSLGNKTGASCLKNFEVVAPPEEKIPEVEIEKLVGGEDFKVVEKGVEYSYTIKVSNPGEVDLKNAVVTDTPDQGITLNSTQAEGTVSNNVWTFTIPELKVGASRTFEIKATVPEAVSDTLTNNVCVNATEIEGDDDACDDADVEIVIPGKVPVCNPENGKIIQVDEDEADLYEDVDSKNCVDNPDTPTTPDTPSTTKKQKEKKEQEAEPGNAEALPTTGPAEVALQMVGASLLTGSVAYYIASRNHRFN